MANTGDFSHKGEANPSTSRFDTGSIGKTAQDTMSGLKDKAQNLASQATEQARGAVGVISERASEIGQQAAQRVGETWEAGRHYVEERGVSGMANDVGELIRKYPLPAVLLGLCTGFFIARSMRD
jgi:hypothetical protein